MDHTKLVWTKSFSFSAFVFLAIFWPSLLLANDSFSGILRLPQGNATITNTIEIELSSFDTLRQFDGRQTQIVTIPIGSSSVAFNFNQIGRDRVLSGFSLSFFCRSCEPDIPRVQYWTLEGTVFSESDQIINNRDLFPQSLDYTLVEGSSISGRIELPNNLTVNRDLNFSLTAARADESPAISFLDTRFTSVTIVEGTNSANFSIRGLRPDRRPFEISYECQNCLTDFRSSGSLARSFLSGADSTGAVITLNQSGLDISGSVTIPDTLRLTNQDRIEITYVLEDFDNFFNPLTELTQSYSITESPQKINYGILVQNGRWESVEVEYRCFSENELPCQGVIAEGTYDEDSEPFNISARGSRLFISDFDIEFSNANENINFCLPPDENGDGQIDGSRAACSIFNISPILQLLLN